MFDERTFSTSIKVGLTWSIPNTAEHYYKNTAVKEDGEARCIWQMLALNDVLWRRNAAPNATSCYALKHKYVVAVAIHFQKKNVSCQQGI